MDQSSNYDFRPNDEVAILPTLGAPASAVLGVAKIAHRDARFVQLPDGRIFSVESGVGLNTTGWITRANREHHKLLKMLAPE